MTPTERKALGLPTYWRSGALYDVDSVVSALRSYRGTGQLTASTTTTYRTWLRLHPTEMHHGQGHESTETPLVLAVSFGRPAAEGGPGVQAPPTMSGHSDPRRLADILESTHGGMVLAHPVELVEVPDGEPANGEKIGHAFERKDRNQKESDEQIRPVLPKIRR